jgi:type IV secretory pathway TraG/TraD family ATPase VirD4
VVLLWTAIVVVVLAVGSVTAAVHLAIWLDGSHQQVPTNPFDLFFGVLLGDVPWPARATVVLAVLVGLVLLLAGAVTAVVLRAAARRGRADRAAAKMGRGRDLRPLTAKGQAATAARLGVTTAPRAGAKDGTGVGLPIGQLVAGGQRLYQGWEDVSVDIWGPRTGKTTSRAIPAILAAPGPVVATSNKRDIVDATRDPRAAAGAATGGEVWVFDPQAIAGEPTTWWWNPLSYVTDEVRASILADLFALASRDPGARTDAYFDSAGQDLLAGLLLAAALDHRPITQVYLWLSDPTDDEPVLILRRHDFPLSAAAVAGVVNAPEKQRGGIYGTAQQIASFLTNRQAVAWVTPPPDGQHRREFNAAAFVRTGGTLYSLSKEGRGSAGPLVAALTVAVAEAAEDFAKQSPGGRLAVPMVAVLDEAANVCRWRELPNLYSHYGSRGICVMTILQSWSQGVEVWGRDGMSKLWSAATVRLYGGGVSEVEFLSGLSQLVGDYDLTTVSSSHGRGGPSRSYTTRRERILDIADLGALPRGRAVLIASGQQPTLVQTIPWMTGPHADAVRASIATHDPIAATTLAVADTAGPLTQPDATTTGGADVTTRTTP